MTRLRAVVPVALLCVLVACSEAPSGGPSSAATEGAVQENRGEGDEKRGGRDGKRDEKKDDNDSSEDDGAVEADGGEGAGEGEDALTEGSAEDDNSSAGYPAAGNYSYSQSGYEEFCNGPQCERQALPREQPVTIRHESAGPDAAVVVMEVQASDNRVARSTTRYSRRDALITKVYVRFAYEGFVFEETYTPEPPVEALRFPLRAGRSWKGRWKDSTSGSYEIRVFEREGLEVGGRSVQAYRVETLTEFRGQFNGKSRVETWIDPATKAIVQTRGVLNVTSTFGRYSTSFSTQLRSGPGYQ